MSSLLQFRGQITKRGVALQAYQTSPSQKFMLRHDGTKDYYLADSQTCGDTTDGIYFPGGKFMARVWTFTRKPKGMFGCWVVFRWNNEEHVPDLSCPMGLFKLPKDAKPMSNDETVAVWKS